MAVSHAAVEVAVALAVLASLVVTVAICEAGSAEAASVNDIADGVALRFGVAASPTVKVEVTTTSSPSTPMMRAVTVCSPRPRASTLYGSAAFHAPPPRSNGP
ncbi:hypothetical protein GCM10025876_31670 [Demequina litorisediminis]|uniref:Uncharacterized protein n=1 Tax=Demequina litorisediminis TaxID=1849022 RepID=A0ABQ6IJR9_9MICO|nr:hypothetical protein GCM10025876_31670 [Demequina litorisediminis]